jgi:hypothetical protein
MADTAFLFQVTRAKIGSIELDASISESHVATVDVTEHPVEEGSNIVDHARPKPLVLTIEGLVSNTPMPFGGEHTETSRGVDFKSNGKGDFERAGKAFADLIALKDSAKQLTVVTALKTYEGMMIRSLTVPRDARIGQALRFTCELIQVRTVRNATVRVIAKALPKRELEKKGAVQGPEYKSSLLVGGFKALGVIH